MTDIFLSYASEDRERVVPLVKVLEADGFSVWWDRELHAGSRFDEVIEREIGDAACMVVVWSHASVKSDWVRDEANEGRERRILVPVVIDDVKPPMGFRAMHTAQLVDWPSNESELSVLIAGIRALLGAGDRPSTRNEPSPSNRPSIVILPFANLSDDEKIGYLADGMTDDVITLLSRDPNLFVAARNSAFSYKGEYRDVREVARELSVRYVVEGGVRGVGERIRVSVQLIEAETGSHLWAERFDKPISKIFEVQDEVIEGVVVALGGELYRAEALRAHRRSPESLDAWGLVARATTELGKLGTGGYEEVEDLTRQAIALDPEFALAHALLANAMAMRISTSSWLSFSGSNSGTRRGLDEENALRAAEQAMTLGPDDPLVLAYSANAFIWLNEPERALSIAQHSYELAPNIATTYGVLAYAYMRLGRHEEAIASIKRALDMSPRDLSRGRWYTTMTFAYSNGLQWEEAVEAATNATERMPNFAIAWVGLAVAQRMVGSRDRSIASARVATERAPMYPPGWKALADSLGAGGDTGAAIHAAQMAMDLEPEPLFLHAVTLANSLGLAGKMEEAKSVWEQASPTVSVRQLEETNPEQPVSGLIAAGVE